MNHADVRRLRQRAGWLLTLALLGATGEAVAQEEAGSGSETAGDGASGEELRIYLMTMGQGPAIWEHFGHNALVIVDLERGTSTAWS